jgi:serine/threonine protein kinase
VSYIEHTDEDTPMLIMEYVAGNNLRKQDHEPLIPAKVATLLYQMLLSLQYMHGRPRRVVHRDIKPENILIETRRPLLAKLGDFGFAWDGSTVRGTVGTPEFCAPEVSSYQPYDTPVDIWSLGVVILEMLWQPGGMALNFRGRRQGPAWCKYVVQLAQSKAREPVSDDEATKENVMTRIHLVRFLSTHMLKMNPQERRSAEFCLNAGMSPTFRLWGQSSETDRNLASPTDPTAALEEPRTKENVRDKRDLPARQKSSEAQPRRKRDAPDSSSGGDLSHAEYVSPLAPEKHNPTDYPKTDRSPLEAESSKRARLAQEHSGPIPPSAPPPARQPKEGRRKAGSESEFPAAQRVTRNRTKKGNLALLEGLQ